jgi:hypothetical protein
VPTGHGVSRPHGGIRVIQRIDSSRPLEASRWGWRCFQIGLFLLPSSALLASLLLFPSLLMSSWRSERPFWRDPWNAPLFVASLLMVIGCFASYSGSLGLGGYGELVAFLLGVLGLSALCQLG